MDNRSQPPPRSFESLNDPISVAAVFHFAISRDEESLDPILRATLYALRSVLDDRAEPETYAEGDLAHFGPMWRLIGEQANEPFDGADLAEVAERVLQLNAMTETIATSGTEVVAVDGQTINFPSATRDRGWLIASALPRMLYRAGITLRVIPSLILLSKFLPKDSEALVITLEQALSQTVNAGLRDLDQIERSVRHLDTAGFTSRSKAPF